MTPHRMPLLDLWRDYRDDARTLPGMHLGTLPVLDGPADPADTAGELYTSGVRRAEFAALVDLTDADPARAVRTLDLVRELTACGIVVDWRVRLPRPAPGAGTLSALTLGHLYPPREVEGPADAAALRAAWAERFFLGKCVVRHGPGFLEIRDHRSGVLNRIVVDEPDYLAAARTVRTDASAAGVPRTVLADLAAESLLLDVGGLHWWAPYRPRRWPQPPFRV